MSGEITDKTPKDDTPELSALFAFLAACMEVGMDGEKMKSALEFMANQLTPHKS